MNFAIWQRIWAFLNRPLWVKYSSPDELTVEEKINYLERCLTIDIPKRRYL